MINSIKKLALPIAILVIVGFILFVVNQISGVYLLVRANNVTLANVLLVALICLAIGLFAWPFILYLKLPQPIKPPKNSEELPKYRKRLLKRLKSNNILKAKGQVPADEADLDTSLDILHTEANEIIKQTATAVFLTTSVSQNGKLDAFTILVTQSRMVWKIAHIYYQRPSLRELTYLYANVGATSLLATEIEDMDISQQVEPVITSFFKNSAGKSIPVIGPTANIILDSLLEGSTNSFLTIRVGVIAKKYCGCNETFDRKQIRKSAFQESSSILKEIVMKSSGRIISGLLKATRRAGLDTIKSGWKGVKDVSGKVVEQIGNTGKKINPFK